MNILEIEDLVKGMPDEVLFREAQSPSGQVPQFLTISEIQRRTDMRKRFTNQLRKMPESTVSNRIMHEGIAAIQGTQPVPPVQGYAEGGGIRLISNPTWDAWREEREARKQRNLDEWDLMRALTLSQLGTERGITLNEGALSGYEYSPYNFEGISAGSMEVQGQDARVQSLGRGGMPDPSNEGDLEYGAGAEGKGLDYYLAQIEASLDDPYPQREGLDALIAQQRALADEYENRYSSLAEAQRSGYPDVSGLVDEQRSDAWSNALVQLGAGIAADDLSGGLSRAGTVGMDARRAAREMQLDDNRARLANETLARRLESEGYTGALGLRGDALAMTQADQEAAYSQAIAEQSRVDDLRKALAQYKTYTAGYAGRMDSQAEINKRTAVTAASRAAMEILKNSTILDVDARLKEYREVFKKLLASYAAQMGVTLSSEEIEQIGNTMTPVEEDARSDEDIFNQWLD